MCNKLCTLIVVGGIALLAALPASLACDKEKQVAAQTASQATVVQVGDAPACWKSRKAAAAVQVADVTDSKSACSTTKTMKLLANAIKECKPECAGRADVIAAYCTMAEANPEKACEKLMASFDDDDASFVVVVNADKASHCRAAKAKATKVAGGVACDPSDCAKAKATKVAGGVACDPAACGKGKATKASNASGACCPSKQAKASYVAFGCQKTDKVARAAARAYLALMSELKDYSGAEGCSASAANQVLASVLADMQAERAAQVEAVVETESVSNIETSVSFGAVSDTSETKKYRCGSSKK